MIPEYVSAEDAKKDRHPQMRFTFGKKRRRAQVAADAEEAIRVLDVRDRI